MFKRSVLISGLFVLAGCQITIAAQPQPEQKGYGKICRTDSCGILEINPDPAPSQPPVAARISETVEKEILIFPPVTPLPKADISINFSYSEPDGNGVRYMLDNGTSLYSGDEFKISVKASSDSYIYLFHFDSNGQVNDLLAVSGRGNYIREGDQWLLPSKEEHFTLDDKVGTETIHTIVAPKPLSDLEAQYRDKLLSPKMMASYEKKGIFVAKDIDKSKPLRRRGPRLLACPAKNEYCHEPFTIYHLEK